MRIYRGFSLGLSFFTTTQTSTAPQKIVIARAATFLKKLGIGLRFGLWLAFTMSFLTPSFAQTTGLGDKRLETKVSYSIQQASVQDIVQQLAQQAGLDYDRQKSFAQTDPICRQWVRGVAIE